MCQAALVQGESLPREGQGKDAPIGPTMKPYLDLRCIVPIRKETHDGPQWTWVSLSHVQQTRVAKTGAKGCPVPLVYAL